jgi:hypothetical protein
MGIPVVNTYNDVEKIVFGALMRTRVSGVIILVSDVMKSLLKSAPKPSTPIISNISNNRLIAHTLKSNLTVYFLSNLLQRPQLNYNMVCQNKG